jgi:sugar lactone lactonase YvrE
VWVTPPAPDLECSVCSEVFTDPVQLACGHTFCRACAVRWFTSSAKRCPVARCAASAGSKPASLPTAFALKGVVEALRVYCRFGVREDERGAWKPDPEGCLAQLSRSDAAAHEAACEHALEACPFAGCGVQRRRRDADAHDAEMAVAHARGERDARLDALTRLDAQQARLDALEVRLAAVVPAAAGGSGAVRAITGAVRCAALEGHNDMVYACAWSPDGSMLVSGDCDGKMRWWDVATLECSAVVLDAHNDAINDCAWSPDGRAVASASDDGKLKLWCVETRTCLATLANDSSTKSCAWSPDGRSLASICVGFKVWDVATRSCTATLADCFCACAWSPDGRTVLIVGNTVTLWDVTTRECAATLDPEDFVRTCAWSPDGRSFVTGDDCGLLEVRSAAAPFSCTATLQGHTQCLNSCAWSPDGCTIASSSADDTVKLWVAATGVCCATLECGAEPNQCCWSPDSNTLAVGCDDCKLVLYDMQRT